MRVNDLQLVFWQSEPFCFVSDHKHYWRRERGRGWTKWVHGERRLWMEIRTQDKEPYHFSFPLPQNCRPTTIWESNRRRMGGGGPKRKSNAYFNAICGLPFITLSPAFYIWAPLTQKVVGGNLRRKRKKTKMMKWGRCKADALTRQKQGLANSAAAGVVAPISPRNRQEGVGRRRRRRRLRGRGGGRGAVPLRSLREASLSRPDGRAPPWSAEALLRTHTQTLTHTNTLTPSHSQVHVRVQDGTRSAKPDCVCAAHWSRDFYGWICLLPCTDVDKLWFTLCKGMALYILHSIFRIYHEYILYYASSIRPTPRHNAHVRKGIWRTL